MNFAALKPYARASLWLVPLAFLWYRLLEHLRIEWDLNPQYSYGWAVPFLSAYLLWRGAGKADRPPPTLQKEERRVTRGLLAGLAGAMALYLPTRLVQVANPDWRLVGWALAIEVIGFTLLAIGFTFGPRRMLKCTFAVCFLLVAVPWPTLIEAPVVQTLAQANASATVELMVWFGVPALQHGNTIEVASGVVGVDDACSGIRSLQATLMIALFLGEQYALRWTQRSLLVLAGFVFAFSFNVARTSLLVWVAASKGVPAIDSWHDPSGVTILLLCFGALWWFSTRLRSARADGAQHAEADEQFSLRSLAKQFVADVARKRLTLSAAACIWLVLVETGVESWYRSHEARTPPATLWTVTWPTGSPAYQELSFAENTRQILRYDEGRNVFWETPDGLRWQAIYLRWKPGRTAMHLARGHTPEVCLTAAGQEVVAISEVLWLSVNGLRMPFRDFQVAHRGTTNHVFYCLWNDRGSARGIESASLTYSSRFEAVRAGLRNPGQRSLEIMVRGVEGQAAALAVVQRQLEALVSVEAGVVHE